MTSNLIKLSCFLRAFSLKTRPNLRESDKTSGLHDCFKSKRFAYLSSLWPEDRVVSSLGRVKQ